MHLVMVFVLVGFLASGGLARAGEPCEDETGYLFKDGPSTSIDGVRPQGACLPSATWQYLRQRQRHLMQAEPGRDSELDSNDLDRAARRRWNQLSPEEKAETRRRLTKDAEEWDRQKNEIERQRFELKDVRRRHGRSSGSNYPD